MNDEDAARVRANFNDAGYIARLKSGDEDATDEFIEWLYWKLPRYITHKFKKSPADAEDFASIAAQHVHSKLDRFGEIKHEGAFEDWIYKVVYHRVLDELDREEGASAEKRQEIKGRRKAYEAEIKLRDFLNKSLPQHEAAILDIIESKGREGEEKGSTEKEGALDNFLTLSESQKSILILRDVLNFGYEDIARDELAAEGKPVTETRLKLKLAAIYKRYDRAKERMESLKQEKSS